MISFSIYPAERNPIKIIQNKLDSINKFNKSPCYFLRPRSLALMASIQTLESLSIIKTQVAGSWATAIIIYKKYINQGHLPYNLYI